jgi:selenocysteine-specific elongation factor
MSGAPVVIGTAGHIDHGKTALVRALTGIDPDRLPVEKARGITTELGFAHLDLAGRKVAVVDVPGHERFVKSMVAGATGLDLVCLVIAADEGVMPQTREHLDICDLLAVRRGVIVVTKRDLVDDAWLAMVTEELRAAVAGTFLAAAPLVAVSARTGAGMAELRATLGTELAALPPRPAAGVFRLPIDRVFTVKGFGTVVTGTILGGEVALGDELTVHPSGLAVRVRGIEVHGAAQPRAQAGHRAALNLGGVAVDDLARGELLAHPGTLAPSHILDVRLRYLPTAIGPLPARSRVLVHHGTAQLGASLLLVEPSRLAPGEVGLAQLRLDATTPLAALPGDRFIVRGFAARAGHGATIGGGELIRVLAPKARRHGDHARVVAELAGARREQRLALAVRGGAAAGLTAAALVQREGLGASELAPALEALVASGELMASGAGDHAHYLHAQTVVELEARLVAAVGGAEAQAEAGIGIARETLRGQLPAALPSRAYDALLAGLVRRGKLRLDNERVLRPLPAAAPRPPALAGPEALLLERFRAWRLEPPSPKNVAGATGLTEPVAKAALDRLLAAKAILRVKPDLYVEADALADLKARLLTFLDAHATIDAQQWKELTGVSRKYSIPLAEYLDAEKVTLRIGDLRRRR